MNALDKKMWRDLWHLRGQLTAIMLVIACGVATFVMFLTTLDSLTLSRTAFYQEYRFADVFVYMKRAPEVVRQRIEDIPGVAVVNTRVSAPTTVDIQGFSEPITGSIISVSDTGKPELNDIYLRSGRHILPGRQDEVIVGEAFASAHKLKPGDRLSVIIRGARKELRVVGTGVTPEFLTQTRPGSAFPDHKRHAYLWMARSPLGHAYDMHQAFNNAVLRLEATANVQDVITRIDLLLKPYGGRGAIVREDQPSYSFLNQEFKQLNNLSNIFPVMFLAVAAFLLNVVITRLVGTQREQIAALKAFGYSNRYVAMHYLKMTTIIVLIGIVVGIGVGVWLGNYLSQIYATNFNLPFLLFVIQPSVIIYVILVSLIAGMAGTLLAVRSAAVLQPAEAMRPEVPEVYRQTLLERIGLQKWFSPATRMILRHIERQPVKSGLSILGISMACVILMSSRFSEDTIGFMMDVLYKFSQRQDLSVSFVEPSTRSALFELLRIPGVHHGEVARTVSAQFIFEHRSYRTSITGISADSNMVQVLNRELMPMLLPPDGILLGDYFSTKLGIKIGDWITVEVLDGKRPVRQVQVVGLVNQYLGIAGYMNIDALNRLLEEGQVINGALLSVDERKLTDIFKKLKNMPQVGAAVVRQNEIGSFHKLLDESMVFYTSIATVFASIIAVGIIYNSAIIILTERSRELASLRVLGFNQAEIAYILLGELGVLTLLAIPLGFFFGYGMCKHIASMMGTDLYRIPLVLEPDVYAFAALVVLIAAGLSSLLVRRRLDHLDLITALKTKE